MNRRMISAVLILLLLSGLLVSAAATENAMEAKLYTTYWKDDVLYAFLGIQSEDPTDVEVDLFVNNAKQHTSTPQTLAEADGSVHFMLLVDVSPSMIQYKSDILLIAKKLMESRENVRISIAEFNRKCTIVAEDLTEWTDVRATLNKLNYIYEGSDIAGSVALALEHLGKRDCVPGEMTNLLVITDGEVWYSSKKDLEQIREAEANQAAEAYMAAYPEIVVHTYSFSDWNEDAFAVLSKGKGIHQTGIAAKDAADVLAAYAASVYSVTFPLSGDEKQFTLTDNVELWIDRMIMVPDSIRNISVAPKLNLEVNQETEPTESTQPSTGATEPEESDPAATDPSSGATDSDSGQNDRQDPNRKGFLWWIIGGAGVLTAVFFLVLRHKRPAKSAIRMKIEADPNSNVLVKDVYFLERELLLGSGRNCDIQILGSGRGQAVARIFLRDQMVYIENLGSPNGIMLNGVQIFASNRLRSGDEITIGNATIRARF